MPNKTRQLRNATNKVRNAALELLSIELPHFPDAYVENLLSGSPEATIHRGNGTSIRVSLLGSAIVTADTAEETPNGQQFELDPDLEGFGLAIQTSSTR